ncbi:MAG: hypothetical protein MR581_03755 [Lachnospiraceae bacterium]|nr:hypothetical protein [Lachnospiraceae bacterium]HBB61212.1 hypothetical protein [Lachnospiraceae bacterium]
MTPEEFQKKLQDIVELAKKQNQIISQEDVRTFFAKEHLNQEQLDLVFEFLQSRHIIVRGYHREPEKNAGVPETAEENSAGNADGESIPEKFGTEQEQHYLEMYLDEIAAVRPLNEEERQTLLERLRSKDPASKRRLTELMLSDIVKLAKQMRIPEVSLQDLIQEANLQLVLAVDMMDYRMTGSLKEVHDRLLEDARQAMETMIEEQKDVHTRDRRMVEKVEEMKDAINVLKKKLGRKVYLDEVADYLEITEEEAADILRLAGEEVKEEGTDEEK